MNVPPQLDASAVPPLIPREPGSVAPDADRVLRKLFLTLFLRGRSSRGLRVEKAPKSVLQKLGVTTLLYAVFGLIALSFLGKPVFAVSAFIHAMTLMFLGMFVAASAGEVLFNREESDILGHRPVRPQALLRAKVRVLLSVSLVLAAAMNLAALAVGVLAPDGGWRFPPAHAASLALETVLCVGGVVLTYQLCLRWFGRERLDSWMTTAQVMVSIAAVIGAQLVPQIMIRFGHRLEITAERWWILALPPAWFAGLDDALAGRGGTSSWVLGGLGTAATGVIAWLALERLAGDYESGLKTLTERPAGAKPRAARRWRVRLTEAVPLRWWLRDPVSRASFLLTAAYLIRDRDVKLRVYPALAPMLVVPVILLLRGRQGTADFFGPAFIGSYLGLLPMMGVELMEFSQQWQAADVFRSAPVPGPARLCHGARRAVLCFLALPGMALAAAACLILTREPSYLLLMLPGLMAVPVFALFPNWKNGTPPLSRPVEEGKAAGRALGSILVMIAAMLLSVPALWAWENGWFGWWLFGEGLVLGALYAAMRISLSRTRWSSPE